MQNLTDQELVMIKAIQMTLGSEENRSTVMAYIPKVIRKLSGSSRYHKATLISRAKKGIICLGRHDFPQSMTGKEGKAQRKLCINLRNPRYGSHWSEKLIDCYHTVTFR